MCLPCLKLPSDWRLVLLIQLTLASATKMVRPLSSTELMEQYTQGQELILVPGTSMKNQQSWDQRMGVPKYKHMFLGCLFVVSQALEYFTDIIPSKNLSSVGCVERIAPESILGMHNKWETEVTKRLNTVKHLILFMYTRWNYLRASSR